MWKIIAGIAAGVVLFVAVFVVYMLNFGIANAYYQWGAGNLVVDYMSAHDGKWPKSWDDLRSLFNAGGMWGNTPFDQFRRRIWIDFDADAKELSRMSIAVASPPFNVINTADRIGMRFEGNSGNEIVFLYFKRIGLPQSIEQTQPAGRAVLPPHDPDLPITFGQSNRRMGKLPARFDLHVGDDGMVLTRPGITIRIDERVLEAGETAAARLAAIQAAAPITRMDDKVQTSDGITRFSYRLRTTKRDRVVNSLTAFVIDQAGHVKATVLLTTQRMNRRHSRSSRVLSDDDRANRVAMLNRSCAKKKTRGEPF